MKKLRKYIIALFCMCLTSYSASSFAEDKQYVDVNISDYKHVGGTANAVFANRSSTDCQYELVGLNIAGDKEELASGTIVPGEAIVSTGTPLAGDTVAVYGRIWQPGKTHGLESKDMSFAVTY